MDKEQPAYNYGRVLGVVQAAAPEVVTPLLYDKYLTSPAENIGVLIAGYHSQRLNEKYDVALAEAMSAIPAEGILCKMDAEAQTQMICGLYHALRDIDG